MTALLLDPIYKEHETAWDHPESPERIDAITEAFQSAGLIECTTRIQPREATLEAIARAHDPRYVEAVLATIAGGAASLANGDVSVCRRSGEVARHAAGGVIAAVDAVLSGSADNAFCAVRPPGHHATATRAMGFCIFNNVAVAARHAQAAHGVERVAILDWDVHHGNGTQEIFYADGSVLFCSTHQSPWYPGTGAVDEIGERAGAGFTINRPFRAGADRTEIGGAFREDFLPAVRSFRPQLLLISAGFDSRLGDPLGGFRLTDADFAGLTRDVLEAAAAAGACVVSVLEGGYSPPGLASAATAHIRALLAA
ncbi:MAG: histone deacetylase [Terrimicrobiaceae bacterium]|nr:histone deacetylase [Terrimicrobiaceae bacterium]